MVGWFLANRITAPAKTQLGPSLLITLRVIYNKEVYYYVYQRFPKLKIFCSHFGEYFCSLRLTEGVGCTLSGDKTGYSLQRLVAKVEKGVIIGYFGYCQRNHCIHTQKHSWGIFSHLHYELGQLDHFLSSPIMT